MRWLDGITDPVDISEQALGGGEGQGSLASWVHGVAELDMTEQLNSRAIYSNMNGPEDYIKWSLSGKENYMIYIVCGI